ncbi:hypothetical protein QKU48_gp0531 [Fadolivirus algeromassiliense]|jgi:hypothetical protein|uniref:Uncharacterized protein n=1 Tax=Fadolivirus FV1/VV64 TaxID=3070911 RepID=A0A7D3UV78_9VIRU|nr:hypothetical protein QKU48_gp0531 [Fadolivirus algeromassiliense]QKF93989.1 hypothetical protein Fadolivirus_1_531 [Fadolivirus FV1/VV64]
MSNIDDILNNIQKLQKRRAIINNIKPFIQPSCNIPLEGSGNVFDNDNISVAIIYDIPNIYDNIQTKLLNGNTNPKNRPRPHFTLHGIHFNKKHPEINKFINITSCPSSFLNPGKLNTDFETVIKDAFKNSLYNKLELSHKNEWNKMGLFYALPFNVNNNLCISDFRKELYIHISNLVQIYRQPIDVERDSRKLAGKKDKYKVYCDSKGVPLYAIQDYYHGIGNWSPHVSMIREDKLKSLNGKLYNYIESSANISATFNNFIGMPIPNNINISNMHNLKFNVICD